MTPAATAVATSDRPAATRQKAAEPSITRPPLTVRRLHSVMRPSTTEQTDTVERRSTEGRESTNGQLHRLAPRVLWPAAADAAGCPGNPGNGGCGCVCGRVMRTAAGTDGPARAGEPMRCRTSASSLLAVKPTTSRPSVPVSRTTTPARGGAWLLAGRGSS